MMSLLIIVFLSIVCMAVRNLVLENRRLHKMAEEFKKKNQRAVNS